VNVWEKENVPSVEKAIFASSLGLTPTTTGSLILLCLPALTETRRRDLCKTVKQKGDEAKIHLRSVRQEANQKINDLAKNKEMSKDAEFKARLAIQQLIDYAVNDVDKAVKKKEREVLCI